MCAATQTPMLDQTHHLIGTTIRSGLRPPAGEPKNPPAYAFHSNFAKATLFQPVTEPSIPVMNTAPMSEHLTATHEPSQATRLRLLGCRSYPHGPTSRSQVDCVYGVPLRTSRRLPKANYRVCFSLPV